MPLLLLLLAFSIPGHAQPYISIGKLTYKVESSTNRTVQLYRADSSIEGEVIIPETINYSNIDYTVISIDTSVFQDHTRITSVTVPETVTSLGGSVFSGCTSLVSVTLPQAITSIESGMFSRCPALTSIEIPATVKKIGNQAFSECAALTAIAIPNSVTEIGELAFSWCTALTSMTIPNSVTELGTQTFKGCSALKSVTLSNSITTISQSTFDGCQALSSIKIPSSVSIIGDYAFSNCTSLKSTNMPEGVRTIGSHAFAGCTSLTSAVIPASVTNLLPSVFAGCTSLERIDVEAGNTKYTSVDGVVFDSGKTALLMAPGGIKEYVSPRSNVETIGVGAFEGCSQLTRAVMYSNVLRIHDSAFKDCSSLESVTMSAVERIGASAFAGCSSLKEANLSSVLYSIGDYAFSDCSSLEFFRVPLFCSQIGKSALKNCKSLKSVLISGSTLPAIDPLVFEGCVSLQEFTEYSSKFSTTEDGALCSADADSLLIVPKAIGGFKIPETVKVIGRYAFYECSSLKAIDIPSSVRGIQSGAFSHCASLASVTIPNTVEEIKTFAFANCSALNDVTFSDGSNPIILAAYLFQHSPVKKMHLGRVYKNSGNVHCFDFMSDLTEVSFGETLTEIQNSTFANCTSLTSIAIPNSVTSIGNSAFFGCSALPSCSVPNSITSIGNSAFSGCSSLESIDLSDSLTSIGSKAFSKCSSLGSIDLPASLTTIGTGAFSYCSSLKSVVIPNLITEINQEVFMYCTALSEVSLPETLTTVRGWAFHFCENLNNLYIRASTPPTIDEETLPSRVAKAKAYATDTKEATTSNPMFPFNNVPRDAAVYVPANTSEIYSATPGWDYFTTFNEMGALEVELDVYELTIEANTSESLTASVTKGDNVTIKSERWASSNPEVAIVENGTVTALAKGETTISFTVADNYGRERTVECIVTVSDLSGVDDIEKETGDAPAEYYNLNGIRFNHHDALLPGIYIKKQGSRTEKIIVI